MLWKGRRQSENLEDRRGLTGRGVALGGGLGALAVTIIVLLLGGNPEEVMQNLQTTRASGQEQTQTLTAEEKEMGEFVGVILADTEDVWKGFSGRMALNIANPNWFCLPAPPIRPVAMPSRPQGHSTALGMKRFIST